MAWTLLSTQRCRGCDLQTTVRRAPQITNHPKVHVVGPIFLLWMSVLSNNSWVEQSEAFVHTERFESSVENAVGCGTESAASRLTCDTCYHRVFLSCRTAFKWLLKASPWAAYIVVKLRPSQCENCIHCHTACSSNSLQSMLTSSPNSAWGQSAGAKRERSRSTCDTNNCSDHQLWFIGKPRHVSHSSQGITMNIKRVTLTPPPLHRASQCVCVCARVCAFVSFLLMC